MSVLSSSGALCLVMVLFVSGCAGAPAPAALSPHGGDACASCRMAVSNPRTAAQIVVSGEEPRFFDDLGCLRDYLTERPLPSNGRAYVADHRTGEWVRAENAVYARADAVETPMGSHLLAWSDEASRGQDPSAEGAERVAAGAVLVRAEGAAR